MYKTSGITANYSKNSITATTFKGNLEGNALTATTALSCSGNSATATLANEAKNLQNTAPETKDESFFSKVVTEDADMVSFQTLKGNSVVWNQLIDTNAIPVSQTISGVTISKVGDKIHIEGTATATFDFSFLGGCKGLKQDHKYVFMQIGSTKAWAAVSANGYPKFEEGGVIRTLGKVMSETLYISGNKGDTYNDDIKVALHDLTQMFGAGNEPSTYEEFLSRKPKVADEYAYNEGTIVNNKVEKVVTTGRNLWDEEWETSQNEIMSKNFNPIIPGVSIYGKCPANSEIRLDWYDANKEYISYRYTHNREIQVPANTHYFKISTYQYGTTYNHDICINLSDPAINGQYFPYEKHELDLSWVKDIKDSEGVKLFEDGMRSAGTAFDEVGKNKAVKRLGSVDLGKLKWSYGGGYFYAPIDSAKLSGESLTSKYRTVPAWEQGTDDEVCFVNTTNNNFVVFDSKYTTASAFKAHFTDDDKLYFELAEPIEVELPYGINHTLPVWKDGMMYAESSQSSTPIVCTNAYYTNIRESVKKFIGDADSIYASTSGYNAHGT